MADPSNGQSGQITSRKKSIEIAWHQKEAEGCPAKLSKPEGTARIVCGAGVPYGCRWRAV